MSGIDPNKSELVYPKHDHVKSKSPQTVDNSASTLQRLCCFPCPKPHCPLKAMCFAPFPPSKPCHPSSRRFAPAVLPPPFRHAAHAATSRNARNPRSPLVRLVVWLVLNGLRSEKVQAGMLRRGARGSRRAARASRLFASMGRNEKTGLAGWWAPCLFGFFCLAPLEFSWFLHCVI